MVASTTAATAASPHRNRAIAAWVPSAVMVSRNAPWTSPPDETGMAPARAVMLAMNDAGINGDETAGDGVYSVTVPPQANRTLVRYRITCTDSLGAARRAPFEDDPSLNFAWFVYNGVPDYLGFPAATLQTLDRKSTRLNSSHIPLSRMPSSA